MNRPALTSQPVAWLPLPPSRYRSPRDVIVLIGGTALLTAVLAAITATRGALLGPAAPIPSMLGSGEASRVLTGLVQAAVCLTAAGVIAAGLQRRFRLLAGLAVAGGAAAAATAGILALAGDTAPHVLALHLARRSWPAGTAFPDRLRLAGRGG